MPLRARLKKACEIARIDPHKVNEAISAKTLRCVPETRAGSARVFNRDEIVMLCIYAWLIKNKVQSDRAGDIAEWVFDTFRDQADVSVVTHGSKLNGAVHTVAGNAAAFPAGYTFDIATIRELVDQRLEWERDNQVVGDD